jgi:hypothetical protein
VSILRTLLAADRESPWIEVDPPEWDWPERPDDWVPRTFFAGVDALLLTAAIASIVSRPEAAEKIRRVGSLFSESLAAATGG